MGIYIVNISRCQLCITKGGIHYIFGTSAFRMRSSDLMRITGSARSRNFTVNSGSPGPGSRPPGRRRAR